MLTGYNKLSDGSNKQNLTGEFMQYASTFLGFVMQIHVFHWLTTSYSQHKALGKLYDGIHDLADDFMETYMGKYGRNMSTSSGSVITYNTVNVNETISAFETFLLSLSTELDPSDTDLLNIRDEMLALVHTTQYFLTLN
jgi:DNA-binding ferritin-like protein